MNINIKILLLAILLTTSLDIASAASNGKLRAAASTAKSSSNKQAKSASSTRKLNEHYPPSGGPKDSSANDYYPPSGGNFSPGGSSAGGSSAGGSSAGGSSAGGSSGSYSSPSSGSSSLGKDNSRGSTGPATPPTCETYKPTLSVGEYLGANVRVTAPVVNVPIPPKMIAAKMSISDCNTACSNTPFCAGFQWFCGDIEAVTGRCVFFAKILPKNIVGTDHGANSHTFRVSSNDQAMTCSNLNRLSPKGVRGLNLLIGQKFKARNNVATINNVGFTECKKSCAKNPVCFGLRWLCDDNFGSEGKGTCMLHGNIVPNENVDAECGTGCIGLYTKSYMGGPDNPLGTAKNAPLDRPGSGSSFGSGSGDSFGGGPESSFQPGSGSSLGSGSGDSFGGGPESSFQPGSGSSFAPSVSVSDSSQHKASLFENAPAMVPMDTPFKYCSEADHSMAPAGQDVGSMRSKLSVSSCQRLCRVRRNEGCTGFLWRITGFDKKEVAIGECRPKKVEKEANNSPKCIPSNCKECQGYVKLDLDLPRL